MRSGHATYDQPGRSVVRSGGGGAVTSLLYAPLSDYLRTQARLARLQGKRPPVVFDIDDTLVWNRGDDDVPIPPMVSLFKECIDMGLPTYVVTARNEKWRKETKKLMDGLKTGLVADETRLLMRKGGEEADVSKNNHRSSIADRHGQILFSVGDQWWDIARRIPRSVDKETPVAVVFLDNKQVKMGAKLPFVDDG